MLAEAGPEGMRVEDIAREIQKRGFRDLRSSKTPEASGGFCAACLPACLPACLRVAGFEGKGGEEEEGEYKTRWFQMAASLRGT